MNLKMKIITTLISFLSSLLPLSIRSQTQDPQEDIVYSPYLIPDEQGRMVSPGLIPDNFLTKEKTEEYRLQLASMLYLDVKVLDYSLNSLDIIENAKNQEKYKKVLIYSWHLYLPLLSYISQVVIRHRTGKLLLEREKYITHDPASGYHNVRIPSLIVVFNDKGKISISRILGKEFSRVFHYTLRQSTETILKAGTHSKPCCVKSSER